MNMEKDKKNHIARKYILLITTIALLTTQLAGCAFGTAIKMRSSIKDGQPIDIQPNSPTAYDVSSQGTPQDDLQSVPLDQLTTYMTGIPGFRQNFEVLFHVSDRIDPTTGIPSKQGCLYVVEQDGKQITRGNTALKDAFRNQVFITKYWKSSAVQKKLAMIVEQAYVDVSRTSQHAIPAVFNAYYNLIPDATNPSSFNPTQAITREQFYALFGKASEGIPDLNDPSIQTFAQLTGGLTAYTPYIQIAEPYGFLPVSNKSLDETALNGTIGRAEAIYMLVLQNFPELYEEATVDDSAYRDTRKGKDLASKLRFKGDGNTERWQAYTLAYMYQFPSKGMQTELYRAMVVAKQLGLIQGEYSRWDEELSRSEAINLVILCQLAMNERYGYLTTTEYGE